MATSLEASLRRPIGVAIKWSLWSLRADQSLRSVRCRSCVRCRVDGPRRLVDIRCLHTAWRVPIIGAQVRNWRRHERTISACRMPASSRRPLECQTARPPLPSLRPPPTQPAALLRVDKRAGHKAPVHKRAGSLHILMHSSRCVSIASAPPSLSLSSRDSFSFSFRCLQPINWLVIARSAWVDASIWTFVYKCSRIDLRRERAADWCLRGGAMSVDCQMTSQIASTS